LADTHVTITGNLTDDPDLRYTANGTEVANFRLARHRPHQGRRQLARRRDLVLPGQRVAARHTSQRRRAQRIVTHRLSVSDGSSRDPEA
jgi:hypothetical protein